MKLKKSNSSILVYGLLLFIIAGIGLLHSKSQDKEKQKEPLILFDHYHSLEEIAAFLKSAADQYDNLVTLIEIGRSRANRPIYAIEINNPATGQAHEKPAFYLDGNIHGGEVLSGEGALYIINLLLTHYETDKTIRTLVDTRVFYIVPVVNLGWMPTATEYAAKVLKIAKPVTARLILINAELVESTDVVRLGVLPGKREDKQSEEFPIHWFVKILNPDEPAFAKIEVLSEKAGVKRQRVDLPIQIQQ